MALDPSWNRGGVDVIVVFCGGSGGVGVHCFSELLVCFFYGCDVVKLENIGGVVQWDGAVD